MERKDLVLVIDMQNAYLEGGPWPCVNIERAGRNILALLEGKKDVDFSFTKFISNPEAEGVWKEYNRLYEDINLDAWQNEIMDMFKPYVSRYPVYTKSTYSSLGNGLLREACCKAERVVLCGVVAECCVLSTLFSLVDEGKKVIYIRDAVSGLTEETEKTALETALTLSPLHVAVTDTLHYLKGDPE